MAIIAGREILPLAERVFDPDVLDDYREITISLAEVVGYPKMVITNIDYPSSVAAGQTFNITVYYTNEGEAGTAWIRVVDLDTGEEVVPRQTFSIDAGKSGGISISFTMPDRNVRLRIELGHVE
ncbi:hypothetical protein DRP04_01865 [Archaeoglobales archaeon]|nr:MAG: hypothetical protein DRP04_01865 [Archaeoglobales archaeon]